MTSADEQVMLTLAGLTYRGFADVLSGEPHAAVVCREVLEGLQTLPPVRNDWELVWGPVTARGPRAVFDSSAMYVVRHRRDRHRYVAAIRGTNPVSLGDWLIGDLWVRVAVAWPYATVEERAEISASTAVGLHTLQTMHSPGVPAAAPPDTRPAGEVGAALAARIGHVHDDLQRLSQLPMSMAVQRLFSGHVNPPVSGMNLRPALQAPGDGAGLDLLSFLRREADAATQPLELAVTGHSKGGALAPAVALWLAEAARSGVPGECWDVKQSARVSCHAFAGPTPGNAAFAARLDRILGAAHLHARNMNDVVTHAWQDDELRQIPGLYGARSAAFAPLLELIAKDVRPIGYRHALSGVHRFDGGLDGHRPFGVEFVHQHMEAYLGEFGLAGQGIHAVTFFT